jgi:putative PIN family toxin of toxin-antitoxin system
VLYAKGMTRVVFDTVVFVRALINPHGQWGRLIFAHFHHYQLCLSQPVVEEVVDVLHRPELTRKFRTLPGLDLVAILHLLGQAELVEEFATPKASRDPKDDQFRATAQAAGDTYVVSEDQDPLVLGEFDGVQVVTAAAFLRLLDLTPAARKP